MPGFYENLDKIERLIGDKITLQKTPNGEFSLNGHLIHGNEQLPIIRADLLLAEAKNNPTLNTYIILFQKMGIFSEKQAEIPIISDIPLRLPTKAPNADLQHQVFAEYLEKNLYANQWPQVFPNEYNIILAQIKQCYITKPVPKAAKKITQTPEGIPLTSGGYDVELHNINGLDLWLRKPDDNSEKELSWAAHSSLDNNSELIANHLKFTLLAHKMKIAFYVRGVSKSVTTVADVQQASSGGGHHSFLMLDRETNTIYAINNAREGDDENFLVFKKQLQLFLRNIGDNTEYDFEYIPGKSRQPDDASYLEQVCSVSQFIHYMAISSGSKPQELQNIIPPKISTLLYLLSYANLPEHKNDKKLYEILNTLATQMNTELGKTDTNDLPPKTTPALFNNLMIILREIDAKAAELDSRGCPDAAIAARTLSQSIKDEVNGYSATNTHDLETFKKKCLPHIHTAKNSALNVHRDCNILLANLALCIAGLGIGYLIAGLVHKAFTGKFLFFETKSIQKVNCLAREIEQLNPTVVTGNLSII